MVQSYLLVQVILFVVFGLKVTNSCSCLFLEGVFFVKKGSFFIIVWKIKIQNKKNGEFFIEFPTGFFSRRNSNNWLHFLQASKKSFLKVCFSGYILGKTFSVQFGFLVCFSGSSCGISPKPSCLRVVSWNICRPLTNFIVHYSHYEVNFLYTF